MVDFSLEERSSAIEITFYPVTVVEVPKIDVLTRHTTMRESAEHYHLRIQAAHLRSRKRSLFNSTDDEYDSNRNCSVLTASLYKHITLA